MIQSHTHKTDQWQCAVDSQVPSQVHITISLIHQRPQKPKRIPQHHLRQRQPYPPSPYSISRPRGWRPRSGKSRMIATWRHFVSWDRCLATASASIVANGAPHTSTWPSARSSAPSARESCKCQLYESIESIVVGWKQNTVLLNAKTAIQKSVRKINNIQVCNWWSVCMPGLYSVHWSRRRRGNINDDSFVTGANELT